MQTLKMKDPYMLLSTLNMKLRDAYASLEALCEDYDECVEVIIERMDTIGYSYNSERNQFTQIVNE